MKWGKAIGYGTLIWVIGFVWGTVVFMTPALKAVPSIQMFSRYPLISFPLLILFPWLAYVFAPKCLTPPAPGNPSVPQVGIVFVVVNVLLDAVILVGAFKSGWQYFTFLSVWLCYVLMIVTARMALKKMAAVR